MRPARGRWGSTSWTGQPYRQLSMRASGRANPRQAASVSSGPAADAQVGGRRTIFGTGGGSALIAASYKAAERGRVQPVAEILIIGAQVAGSLSASAYTTAAGWRVLGWGCVAFGCAVAASLGLGQFRRRTAGTTLQ